MIIKAVCEASFDTIMMLCPTALPVSDLEIDIDPDELKHVPQTEYVIVETGNG